jgi:hypothetical protein
MTYHKLGLYALTALMLSACVPPEPAPVVRPTDGGDARDCPAMCATVERLGCAAEWGIDIEDGACLSLCQRIEATGTMCPAWVADATSCAEADALSQCGDVPE